MRHLAGRWTIIALFVALPTAAFAAVPSLHLGRTADVIDAVPAKTVLDTENPTVEVKVTNNTGVVTSVIVIGGTLQFVNREAAELQASDPSAGAVIAALRNAYQRSIPGTVLRAIVILFVYFLTVLVVLAAVSIVPIILTEKAP